MKKMKGQRTRKGLGAEGAHYFREDGERRGILRWAILVEKDLPGDSRGGEGALEGVQVWGLLGWNEFSRCEPRAGQSG